MTRKTTLRSSIVAILMTLALMLSTAPAFAAGGPPPGKGGGGGETTVANSLSVPALMVTSNPFGLNCPTTTPSTLLPPSGVPSTGWEINPTAYYYVQGVSQWQAQCQTVASGAKATAAWGDNLTGAPLKAGTPIRVEIGLVDSTGLTMQGYDVVKLQPSLLDRLSAYGTLATGNSTDGFTATPSTFPLTKTVDEEGVPTTVTIGIRVFDPLATFSIQNLGTSAYVVQPGTAATAEINATGAVVYGYNWGSGKGKASTPAAGNYRITFTFPQVELTGTDAGTVVGLNEVYLDITVAAKSGGGRNG